VCFMKRRKDKDKEKGYLFILLFLDEKTHIVWLMIRLNIIC